MALWGLYNTGFVSFWNFESCCCLCLFCWMWFRFVVTGFDLFGFDCGIRVLWLGLNVELVTLGHDGLVLYLVLLWCLC